MQTLPPIESLECFLAAAKILNFSKASVTVNLSPAAFGQRIRQLEEFVGVALFARSTRHVQLTDAGRRLIPRVGALLDVATTLPAVAQDQTILVPRTITLGTRHELGLSWLTPLIPRLERAVPGLRVNLHFGSGDDLMRLVESDELEAAICSVRLNDRRFAFEVLHQERYQLVASPTLLRKSPIGSFDALLEHTLIDTNPSLPLARYWLDGGEDRMHLQFKDVRLLGTIGAIRDFVLRGLGVAVLPLYFVERDIARKRLVSLLPKRKLLTDHFRLFYSPSSNLTEAFSIMAEVMRKAPLR